MGTSLSVLVKNQLTLEQGDKLVDVLNQSENFPALAHFAQKYNGNPHWTGNPDPEPHNDWEEGFFGFLGCGCGFNIDLAPHYAKPFLGFKWVYAFMIDAERRMDIRAATYEIAQLLYPPAPRAIYAPDWLISDSPLLELHTTFEQWEEYLLQHTQVPPSPLDVVYPDDKAMDQAEYELAKKLNVERYDFYYIDTFDDLRNPSPK